MANEEKAKKIANDETLYGEDPDENSKIEECYIAAMAMADFKDAQPISSVGGWHTEPPTEDGCYLAETFHIPYKNFHYIVAQYDTNAKAWYEEEFDNEIEIKRWKRI